jgi:chromosome segregation ATPase
MMDIVKKNVNVVFWGLVALLVFCSIWGSINSRNAQTLQLELDELKAEIAASEVDQHEAKKALETHTTEASVRVSELETAVVELENKLKNKAVIVDQLKKARNELVELRKGNKKLEAQVADYKGKLAGLQKSVSAKKEQIGVLAGDAKTVKERLAATQQELVAITAQYKEVSAQADKLTAVNADMNIELEAALLEAEEANKKYAELMAATEELARKYQEDTEVAQAQVIGYEKMIEEKGLALEEISLELDRVKVNNKVLLGKISSQQDLLQELNQERDELVKSLAEKNKMLADLQEQFEQAPAQE